MRDLALDNTTWDLSLSGDDLVLASKADQVTQHIRQRLQTFHGEWFLSLSTGVPWFQDILGKPQRLAVVETILKQEIIKTPGVTELVAFRVDVDDARERVIRVTFTVVVSGEEITQAVETIV